NVTWDDNSDNEVGFEVEKSTDAGVSWVSVPDASVGANATSAHFYTPDQGTDASYRVVAIDSLGERAPSEDVMTTRSGRSQQLQLTATAYDSPPRIVLNWAPYSTVFYIRRSTNPSQGWDGPVFYSGPGSRTDTDVVPGT